MAEQTITEEKIKYATGEYDVEVVRRLALPSARLNRISGIERCVRLVSLSLSQNRIVEIEGLATLTALQRLDLAKNSIRKIQGLATLLALEFLDLQGNQIRDATDVKHLTTLPSLAHLHLQCYDGGSRNPCCEAGNYTASVRAALPALHVLDGERLLLRQEGENLQSLLGKIKPDAQFEQPLKPANWCDEAAGFQWRSDRRPTADLKAAFAAREQALQVGKTDIFQCETTCRDLNEQIDADLARAKAVFDDLNADDDDF